MVWQGELVAVPDHEWLALTRSMTAWHRKMPPLGRIGLADVGVSRSRKHGAMRKSQRTKDGSSTTTAVDGLFQTTNVVSF
jgi:hypothetical protein